MIIFVVVNDLESITNAEVEVFNISTLIIKKKLKSTLRIRILKIK